MAGLASGRAPKRGINWEFDDLTPALAQFTIKANFAIAAAAQDLAREIEQYMKINAPWEDRTRAARVGLNATTTHKGSFRTEILLCYSEDAPHGFWLEVIQNGKFSIIVPTLDHYDGANTWRHFMGVMPAAAKL